MKTNDRIFTVFCIGFLFMVELINFFQHIPGYLMMGEIAEMMPPDANDSLDFRDEILTNFFLLTIMIFVPMILGFIRFRYPDTRWLKVVFYTINLLFLSFSVLAAFIHFFFMGSHDY